MIEIVEILFLIVIANAAPVLARLVFSHHGALAIDFGKQLNNQQSIFGATKTWRGLFSSIVITSLAATAMNYTFITGIIIASLAMLGDLLSSFIKRRLNKPSSTGVILLDQLPECLFPALFMLLTTNLTLNQLIAIIISFIIIELILSALLLRLTTRENSHD